MSSSLSLKRQLNVVLPYKIMLQHSVRRDVNVVQIKALNEVGHAALSKKKRFQNICIYVEIPTCVEKNQRKIRNDLTMGEVYQMDFKTKFDMF